MGLLDTKTRFIDTILTEEGRRQLANGKLRAEFYSFSDSGVFYNLDTLSGSGDIGKRIALEVSSLPQDSVTFEADDSGKLVPFKGSRIKTSNGKIVTFTTASSGSPLVKDAIKEIDGDQFSSGSDSLLKSSINNFNNLYIIGSPDLFNENRNEFKINTDNIEFVLLNDRPIPRSAIQKIDISHVESFFQDSKLSHIPNFNFLPPVNKSVPGSTEKTSLGIFANIGQTPYLQFEDLKSELINLENMGFHREVTFAETSLENNLICQLFELSNGEVSKLDIIDFGMFITDSQITDNELEIAKRNGRELQLEKQTKHVFFAGKVFTDKKGTHNFLNLFVLIFEG